MPLLCYACIKNDNTYLIWAPTPRLTIPMNTAAKQPTEVQPISFWCATLFWLKLGFISFGGPAGQIAIMHQELVEKRHWISERRFLHALNFCMLLPGPEAQQLATYIGWLMHRAWGGLVAGLLFILPSLFILIILAWIYLVYGDVPMVAAVFYTIKPAVIAIVMYAAYRIGKRVLNNLIMLSIALASFIAIFQFKLGFPLIILSAALIGIIGGRIMPTRFGVDEPHESSPESFGKAIIDDHTDLPKHAKFRLAKFVTVILVGLVLWCLPMGLLNFSLGWEHSLTQMGWFFTKAALVTFGGAYAVLPYVYQGAVDNYAWTTPHQMIDGLALGETTPGPLIMVVAFVGFMGGYQQMILSPDQLVLSGVVAACVVTWFTFLPSFVFIFAGGPFIESTHNDINFTAPLSAITAAVVGVIVNLGLFFSYHVLWPEGLTTEFDYLSAIITTIAAVALVRFKCSVIVIIISSAIAGLVLTFLGWV